MTRKTKSLGILSLAVAPVLLFSGPVLADVIFNPIAGTQEDGNVPSTPPRQTIWPGPTAVASGGLPSIIGSDPVIVVDTPNDKGTTGTVVQMGGIDDTVVAETFTVTSAFTLGAIEFEGNAGGAFTDGSLTLHLFQLNNTGAGAVTPTSPGYNLAQNALTTAANPSGDLFGFNPTASPVVGGQGIPIKIPASSAEELMELDLTNNAAGGGTNDQVALVPGIYALELWETNPSSNILTVVRDASTTASYAGGQIYGTNDPTATVEFNSTNSTTNSSTNRGQPTGSTRDGLFAFYAEPSNVSATWGSSVGGDWQAGSNWALGSVPNGASATATFGSAIGSNHTVFTDTAETLNVLNFNSTHSYVLAGTASLTMQAGSGSAQINVGSSGGSVQTQEINLPLIIASNSVFNVFTAGSQLVIADPMTVNAGISVTNTGAGSVVYESTITLKAGASLAIAGSINANALSLTTGSTVSVAPHGASPRSLVQFTGLSFGGSTNGNWLGKLDLSNNDMVVHGGNLANVTNQIAQGRNSGASAWGGGNGITSSLAATTPSTTAIGVEVNDNGSGAALVSTFDGQPVADGDILVKYTYVGDANLSGTISASDYTAIDNGFNLHQSGWSNGDFNYDGVVNGDDYTLIDNAFNTQGTPFLSASAGPTEQIASAISAVPEPGSLSLLAIGGAAILGRRRRRA